MARSQSHLPRDFDVRDPNFHCDILSWAFAMQSEIHELVLATRETIAVSRVIMADADRLIAWRL